LGAGWHRHEAYFRIIGMLKDWVRFVYGDKETHVEAGDCVHQAPSASNTRQTSSTSKS
jgi:hypothetical protein